MKRIVRAMVCGLVLAAVVSLFPFAAAGETLPERVLRLHVLANSDSEADQALKLRVRDAVLERAHAVCRGAQSPEEAAARLCLHLQSIEQAAGDALAEAGSDQSVHVAVTRQYYGTRVYESFTLPAGAYTGLVVTLGKGGGHNWWCVVFPELCLPAAGEPATDETALNGLTPAQRQLVRGPYQVKFKLLEWYQQLRESLDGG